MSIIEQLRYENAQLLQEKKALESDLKIVAQKAGEAWGMLGIDLGDKKDAKDLNVMKVGLGLIKKLTTGELKVGELVKKWEQVQPIINKYPHLLPKSEEKEG